MLILVLLNLSFVAMAFACALMRGTDAKREKFIMVAHRGVTGDGLIENSMAALDETIRQGYTHVEVDLRCLSDGTVVCFHDPTLKRVFGINRDIEELALPELQEILAGADSIQVPRRSKNFAHAAPVGSNSCPT